jgi:hypothetical protein
MEEAAFLSAVQRVVGGVEIENDLLWRRSVRLDEEIDQQPLDRRPVVAEPVVATRAARRMLEPVEGALAGERCAALTSILARSFATSVARIGAWRSWSWSIRSS